VTDAETTLDPGFRQDGGEVAMVFLWLDTAPACCCTGNAETAWDFPMLYLYSDMPEKPRRQTASSHSQCTGI
jgi:hypothetical protein